MRPSIVLNIMDTVKTVKVLYIQTLRQFMGRVYPYTDGRLVVYTVSEVL